MTKYIHMGSLGRPHGIHGEIVLDWYGVSPFSSDLSFWLVLGKSEPRSITIEQARRHNGRLLIRIAGITSREAAAELRAAKLYTLRSDLPEPEDGEAYISDLLGADVFLPNGTRLGRFSHLVQGACVWSISSDDDREILFPADPSFISVLDAKGKRIVIDPPQGLLELYV
ncbi:MAG: ribosome maturation factor RimM [Desulfovibrio sp.]|nr:ribosome maturation factor RimM [Desulfovibrio sp.]